MSAASAGRPDGQAGADDGDEDTSEPAFSGPDENAGPVAGEESAVQDDLSCEPGDDDEYEPL